MGKRFKVRGESDPELSYYMREESEKGTKRCRTILLPAKESQKYLYRGRTSVDVRSPALVVNLAKALAGVGFRNIMC